MLSHIAPAAKRRGAFAGEIRHAAAPLTANQTGHVSSCLSGGCGPTQSSCYPRRSEEIRCIRHGMAVSERVETRVDWRKLLASSSPSSHDTRNEGRDARASLEMWGSRHTRLCDILCCDGERAHSRHVSICARVLLRCRVSKSHAQKWNVGEYCISYSCRAICQKPRPLLQIIVCISMPG